MIHHSGRILRRHIEDLSAAATLETGEVDLAYAEVDLAELVRLAVAHFDAVATDRGITVTVDASQPVIVQIDPQRMGWSVLNVVSNAFQFTSAGGAVTVAVQHHAAGGRGVVTVGDSGPGIPDDEHSVVFERFTQAIGGTSKRSGGAGLGLSIARELVRLHDGTITVGEAPQGGALFTIEIPIHAPRDRMVGAGTPRLQQLVDEMDSAVLFDRRSAAESDTPDRARVLVVEGNADMNRYLRDILSDEYQTAAADSGLEGLALARQLRPDLILCAIMLPAMSGEDVLNEVRRDDDIADTPFVVVTGMADDAQRVRMLRNGATDYLLKPFVVEELRARVAKALADHVEAGQLRASEATAHATAEQLQNALRTRIVIEQAKGIVAAQLGVGVEDAFHVLRAHARGHNVRLHAVADAVVNLGLRPTIAK